jgi:8-hydroxy-5-deazaflavin:NADPH oxidoreductase
MNIGILGAGNMGAALGNIWAAAGHRVIFSVSRDAAKLEKLAREAGPIARAGSVAEAVRDSDVLLLAVWPNLLDEVLTQAGDLTGKILISCVSGLRPDMSGHTMGLPTDLTEPMAAQIARKAPGAHVVEAFNSTFAEIVAAPSRRFDTERPSIFYCGDDPEAKQTTATLIEAADFEAVDAGPLSVAAALETLATAWVQLAMVSHLFPNLGLKALRR